MSGASLRARLRGIAEEGRSALIVYLTEGDPSVEATLPLLMAMAEAGADVIELGVPFSDPSADGIVIQEAMHRALAAGGGVPSCFVPALPRLRGVRRNGNVFGGTVLGSIAAHSTFARKHIWPGLFAFAPASLGRGPIRSSTRRRSTSARRGHTGRTSFPSPLV